jgi:ABC-2 type transport system ATP-binding protein
MVCFAGHSSELTAMAAGPVWQTDAPYPAARLSWLTGDGHYRHIGDPAPDSDLVAPTLEDGYLLLIGTANVGQVKR